MEPSSSIGASLAGLRAAEEVRHEGHTGPVVVVGEETHAPYDRPPLSKQLLSGKWDVERIHHHTPDALDATGLDFRLGRRATGLDVATRTVALDDGTELAYDGLIVATGAATRSLPGTEGMPGVWMLRTLDDCLGIRADLAAAGTAPRVVVIGAGFIGSEVAATCQGLGARVTLLEAYHTPLARVLGDEMGRMCADLHVANGMDLRCGVTVDHLESDPGGPDPVVVCLADGTRLPADVVVVGIGVVALGGMAGGLGPAPRQRGGVRRGALRRRPGGRRRRRGQLDPALDGPAGPRRALDERRRGRCGVRPQPAGRYGRRRRLRPRPVLLVRPVRRQDPDDRPARRRRRGRRGDRLGRRGEDGRPLPLGRPAQRGPGHQPAGQADGLPPAAGRRCLVRRGAGPRRVLSRGRGPCRPVPAVAPPTAGHGRGTAG